MKPPKPVCTKRPRGAGAVTPVWKGDRWKFRARFPDGEGGRLDTGTFGTEDEAHGELNAMAEVSRGSTRGTTLRQYAEAWFRRRQTARDGANLRSERSYWRHVEAAPFYDYRLVDITFADVRDWAWALHTRRKTRALQAGGKTQRVELEETIGRQTQQHALVTLRRCLTAALNDQVVSANVAASVRLPKEKGANKRRRAAAGDGVDEWTFLTAEEIALLEQTEAIPMLKRETLVFAVHTGLREGELWGLHRPDLRPDGDSPHVRVRFSFDTDTKGERERVVPLSPRAAAAARYVLEHGTANKAGLVWVSRRTGRMFADGHDMGWADISDNAKRADGSLRHQGGIRPGLRSQIGIARHVRFHDLRHTCASHLLMGTWGRVWELHEVRDILGHSDLKVTQRYAHLTTDALAKAMRATPGAAPTGPRLVPGQLAPIAEDREIVGTPGKIRTSDLRLRKPCHGSDIVELSGAGTGLGPVQVRELLESIADGRGLSREVTDELARASLRGASLLIATASAVLDAGDADLQARVLDLLRLIAVSNTGVTDPQKERHGSIPEADCE